MAAYAHGALFAGAGLYGRLRRVLNMQHSAYEVCLRIALVRGRRRFQGSLDALARGCDLPARGVHARGGRGYDRKRRCRCRVRHRAAAAQHGLSFVPLAPERYFLALRENVARRPAAQGLLDALRSRWFRRIVRGLPGYTEPKQVTLTTVQEAFAPSPS